MQASKWLIVAAVTLAWPSVAGANYYVLGDSIGQGVGSVSGHKILAKTGIHIRGRKALEQILQAPQGSTVFIFLGTNDAVGSIENLDQSINDIVNAAERRALTVIWAGPPCVRRTWDSRSRELDEVLRVKFASTSIKYVSMRDARICAGEFQGGDGVHMSAVGYHYMWDKVLSVAQQNPGAVLASTAPPRPTLSSGASETTGSVAPAVVASAPQKPRGNGGRRLIMSIHLPGSPAESLLWIPNNFEAAQ
jgi:lysophospholipase L1-like esterase